MKILHFADVHADEKNHEEIQKCNDFIVDEAEARQPDVIICSGDVTNSEYLGAGTKAARGIMETFRRLSDIAPVAVIIGTPSHDGQTPRLLRYVSGKNPIHVSTKPEQIFLSTDNQWLSDSEMSFLGPCYEIKAVISQIPAPTKEHWKNRHGIEDDNTNISEAIGAIFTDFGNTAKEFNGVPHILNGHFSMQGSMITETQLLPGGDISIGSEILALANAELYCLGHIHMRQAYGIMGKEICFHSGSTWRKNFGERNEDKGFYLHELSEAPFLLRSEFVQTPTRKMIQADYDAVSKPELLSESADFSDGVAVSLIESCRMGRYIKIKITIYMDDIRLINQAKLKRLLLENGASDVILEIIRVRRENSRSDEIIKAISLPEKFEALSKYRSEPIPPGVVDMLQKLETMNEHDLVKYANNRIEEVK